MTGPVHSSLIEDDYERLPECIRFKITRKEWLWLSHEQKANLERDETEPEDLE